MNKDSACGVSVSSQDDSEQERNRLYLQLDRLTSALAQDNE